MSDTTTVDPLLCKHGHQLVQDNIYIHPSSGSRICKTCRTDHAKRRIDAQRQLSANIPRFERKWEIDRHLLKRKLCATVLAFDHGWPVAEIARVFGWQLDDVQAWFKAGQPLL